jgi:cytosine/creatinine deaminase
MLPDYYWLLNGQISQSHLAKHPGADLDANPSTDRANDDGLVIRHLEINQGQIQRISDRPPTAAELEQFTGIDLAGGQIWPCFVDAHAHLDKGHIWPRRPNPSGSFDDALRAAQADSRGWTPEDLHARMEFGLKCSYAHGTQALRTHLDSAGPIDGLPGLELGQLTFEVFRQLRQDWADRLTLQAVSLVSLDYFLRPEGEKLADLVADLGTQAGIPAGVLGGVSFMGPDLDRQLERVFELAIDRGLDLDFHVDESGNPDDRSLGAIAKMALRFADKTHGKLKVTCGHCCSLGVQDDWAETIAQVKAANLNVISLPMCNLYLQDRKPGQTPYWRGLTRLHELQQAGVPVAIAGDNCRDPFYGFGDHDMLEVFREAVRIGHLDRPYGTWPASVTAIPADLMGLSGLGRIATGQSADLILFKGRAMGELLSRSQHDRIVLRRGQPIDQALPDYAELDSIVTDRS